LEVEVRVAPDRLPEHLHGAFARLWLTRGELPEGGLAGAVGAEKARDARRHADADVVEADHLAVPLRHVLGGDDRRPFRRHGARAGRGRGGDAGRNLRGGGGDAHVTTSTPRTRRSRIEIDTTTTAMMTSSDTCHGTAYRASSSETTSTPCSTLLWIEIQAMRLLPVIA